MTVSTGPGVGAGGTAPPTHAGRTFDIEPLTPEEVAALIRAVPSKSTSGIRTRALIAVMYGGGLRVQEALDLKPRDIGDCTLHVRNGKGGRSRKVGLDPMCCALLDRWVDRRAAEGLTRRDWLFAAYSDGHLGEPLNQRYVRLTLARFGVKAGIEKRVHPHGLRHSLASDLAAKGVPTHVIQDQLGHANLAVTSAYIRHLNPTIVIDTMRARDWTDGQQL